MTGTVRDLSGLGEVVGLDAVKLAAAASGAIDAIGDCPKGCGIRAFDDADQALNDLAHLARKGREQVALRLILAEAEGETEDPFPIGVEVAWEVLARFARITAPTLAVGALRRAAGQTRDWLARNLAAIDAEVRGRYSMASGTAPGSMLPWAAFAAQTRPALARRERLLEAAAGLDAALEDLDACLASAVSKAVEDLGGSDAVADSLVEAMVLASGPDRSAAEERERIASERREVEANLSRLRQARGSGRAGAAERGLVARLEALDASEAALEGRRDDSARRSAGRLARRLADGDLGAWEEALAVTGSAAAALPQGLMAKLRAVPCRAFEVMEDEGLPWLAQVDEFYVG